MRAGFWMVALPLAGLGLWHFAHSRGPSVGQVEPLLRTYLENSCRGTVEIRQLDSISVGDFAEQMEGWPVYANHVEDCVSHDATLPYSNSLTTSYDGSHDADRKVAVAFARRTASGHLELFEPDIFKAANREMQEMIQKGVDNIKVN